MAIWISPAAAIIRLRNAGFADPVTPATIKNWAKSGNFARKLGGRWKVDREAFDKFIKEETYSYDTKIRAKPKLKRNK